MPLGLLRLIVEIKGDVNRSRFVVRYLFKGLYISGKLPETSRDLLPKEEQESSRPLARV